MADPEDPFLARWSRRKRDTRRDQPAPDAEPERRDPDADAAAPAEDKPPADVAEPLPDIDSLDKTSDFTVFLKEGVPEAIRRKALRRLWRTDPVLANLDGLNDYDEDFSAVGMVTEHLKTIYKVGKGYLDDEDEAPADEVSEDEVPEDEVSEDEVPVVQTAGDSSEATNGGPEPDSPEPDSPEPDSPQTASPESAGPGPAIADNAPRFGKLQRGKSPGRSARNRRWGGFAG